MTTFHSEEETPHRKALFECIMKIKGRNPNEKLPASQYMGMVQSWGDGEKPSPEMYLQACKIFRDSDLYDKPVRYLKGVIKNLMDEKKAKIKREGKEFGSLPLPKGGI